MATYVIGDIHGQLEQLKVLLEKMKFNENDELYVMGDVVDRGPDPVKALQYLMTLPNCVCIAGNHEWMALESLKLMLNEITEEFIQTLDENQVTIATTMGTLVIRGSSLHVDQLSLDSGELRLTGRIDIVEYDDSVTSGGFLRRLFQ